MNRWLLQSISGIKEVKVEQKEAYFLEQFSKYGKVAFESEKINNVLGTVPRLSIEAFGISTLLIVIASMMFNGYEMEKLLPQLSVFAVAAVRLMPSVNRMLSSLNSMSYCEPALDKMMEHLSDAAEWEAGETQPVLDGNDGFFSGNEDYIGRQGGIEVDYLLLSKHRKTGA